MKNIAIIPIAANNESDLEVPLGKLGEYTLLEQVYYQAKKTSVDSVVVTSNSKDIAHFCSTREPKITFFPSSQGCPTGTHRCAEISAKFRPEAKVGNVLCWPISYPFISAFDIDEMIAKYYGEGVATLASSISRTKEAEEEFYTDPTKVKVRVFGNQCADFSRCPLPLSLYHIGIYMYSLTELLKLGQIQPTKLSITEGLEQLSWLSYGTKISVHAVRRLDSEVTLAIRTPEQLKSLQHQEERT